MDLDTVSFHKHAKKKELGGEYPAILTSHLVNNPYILTEKAWSIKGFVIILLWENFFLAGHGT